MLCCFDVVCRCVCTAVTSVHDTSLLYMLWLSLVLSSVALFRITNGWIGYSALCDFGEHSRASRSHVFECNSLELSAICSTRERLFEI